MLVHPGPFISPVVGPKLTAKYNKSVPFNMSLNHPYSVK